jgi:hypothetical protein
MNKCLRNCRTITTAPTIEDNTTGAVISHQSRYLRKAKEKPRTSRSLKLQKN